MSLQTLKQKATSQPQALGLAFPKKEFAHVRAQAKRPLGSRERHLLALLAARAVLLEDYKVLGFRVRV